MGYRIVELSPEECAQIGYRFRVDRRTESTHIPAGLWRHEEWFGDLDAARAWIEVHAKKPPLPDATTIAIFGDDGKQIQAN